MSRIFVYAPGAVEAELGRLMHLRLGAHESGDRVTIDNGLGDFLCIWSGDTDASLPITEEDIIVVAGADFSVRLGLLFGRGYRNVFNGNAILAENEPSHRFIEAAARHYVGPNVPTGPGIPVNEASRFACQPIVPGQVPADKLFVVNSMPKSGTIWMCAMIEALLGVTTRQQITVSHVGDLEDDWNKANNHGAVALVRDMRDVVVSWFHNVQRTDLALGYSAPRYPTIASFYDEHFLGTIRATKRFYGGDFEHWLDLLSANYIPIIRYEDLSADTPAALRKLATFWRIEVADDTLRRIAKEHTMDLMATTVRDRQGYVSELVRGGHIRRGQSGSWREELPDRIKEDIESRFAGYQQRLGYTQ